MDIYEVRRRNFIRVLKQMNNDRAALATLLGFQQVNLIARMISTAPKTRKPIGSKLARKIEAATHKPEGWMDAINISAEALSLAEAFDALPADARATIQNVAALAMTSKPPPVDVLPAPPPIEQKRRQRS